MPEGTLKRQAATAKRKLPEKIDGKDVLVRDLTNDDLDAIDKLTDEYAEIEKQRDEILAQVDEAESSDERRELRAKARELAKQGRAMSTQMLGLYIETVNGEPFDHSLQLSALPIRVQTALIEAATAILFPREGDPTKLIEAATTVLTRAGKTVPG